MKPIRCKPWAALLSGLLFCSGEYAGAQTPIHLRIAERPEIDSTPFGSVRVLDNRIDTTCFLSFEDGQYPRQQVTFDTTAAVAVSRCLDDVMHRIKSGHTELLINLREFHISTQHHLVTRTKDDRVFGMRLSKAGDPELEALPHHHITADVYYKIADDQYRKLFSLYIKTPAYGGAELAGDAAFFLRELFEAASVEYMRDQKVKLPHRKWLAKAMKDTSMFVYDRGGRELSLAEVNRSNKSWRAQYPIFGFGDSLVAGRFESFDDFRMGRIVPSKVRMVSDKNDSVYRMVFEGKDSSYFDMNWGVSDGHYIYFKISPRCYLRLTRFDSAFCFYVPWAMPDMHALLNTADLNYYDTNPNSNLLAAFAGVTLSAGLEAAQQTGVDKRRRQIMAEGFKHDYRNCMIDMDCGDIVYGRKPF